MTTRRRTHLAAALTTVALGAGGAALAAPSATAAPGWHATARSDAVPHTFAGDLVDLAPAVSGPFDGASAVVRMRSNTRGATFHLVVKGVAEAGRGESFGAHLHLGPCVPGTPAAALGHYNTDALAGVTPVVASPSTEVWLDFTVDADGTGAAVAHVPFVPMPGNRSVVIHAESTNPSTGTAGARLACLPVSW